MIRRLSASTTLVLLAASRSALAAPATPPPALTARLEALEASAYAAWKAGDTRLWDDFISRDFVGWYPSGRLDKAETVRAHARPPCPTLTYRLTNQQVTPLTPDAALLTARAELHGTCGGKPLTPVAYTATVYVREAGQWRAAFHAESAVVDPMKATIPANSAVWTGGPTRTDALTQTLLARETALVNAWKDHDARRMAPYFGPDIQFIDIFGNHIGSRAAALKAWSGRGCDVKSFTFTGAKATPFSPDFAILTYRAAYQGTCFGQDLWPIWGTAFYVKHGATWLWSSGINVLAGAG